MARGEIHLELSVDFADDPKLRALAKYGRDVRALRDLYVQMICYCKRNLSDGHVPAEQIGLLVYPDSAKNGFRDARRLAEEGLIEEVDGGYYVPAFLKRNKSREQIEAERLAREAEGSQSGGFGNHKRWHVNRGVVMEGCAFCEASSSPDNKMSGQPDTGGSPPDSVVHRSESESESESELLAPAVPPPDEPIPLRPRDEVWDALMDACDVDTASIPKSARGAYNRAVADLRAIGARPDEIAAKALTFRQTWPRVSLTPTALVRRWSELTPRPAHRPSQAWMHQYDGAS